MNEGNHGDKPKRRSTKRRAVTTVKADTRPIETLSLLDFLVIRPLPTDTAPYDKYPLPESRSIRVGYRVTNRDGSRGPEGSFPYTRKWDGKLRLPLTRRAYDAIAQIDLWAEPYGYATFHGTKPYAWGRINYEAGASDPSANVLVVETRVVESVVGYIVGEMNRNKHAGVIAECRALNVEAVALEKEAAEERSKWVNIILPPLGLARILKLEAEAKAKRVAAMEKFREVETTGAVWDHKVTIGPIWGEVNRLGDRDATYFYDIWSNIHFGYVGHAAAFSWNILRFGSGLQNFWDHFRDDEGPDIGSSHEGFDLYRADRDVTIEDVLAIVRRHPEWDWAQRKPK